MRCAERLIECDVELAGFRVEIAGGVLRIFADLVQSDRANQVSRRHARSISPDEFASDRPRTLNRQNYGRKYRSRRWNVGSLLDGGLFSRSLFGGSTAGAVTCSGLGAR